MREPMRHSTCDCASCMSVQRAPLTLRFAQGERPMRIEKDTLGEVAVPETALYGAQTQRAVENYPISGLREHPLFIRAVLLLKRAAACSNGRNDRRGVVRGFQPRARPGATEATAAPA